MKVLPLLLLCSVLANQSSIVIGCEGQNFAMVREWVLLARINELVDLAYDCEWSIADYETVRAAICAYRSLSDADRDSINHCVFELVPPISSSSMRCRLYAYTRCLMALASFGEDEGLFNNFCLLVTVKLLLLDSADTEAAAISAWGLGLVAKAKKIVCERLSKKVLLRDRVVSASGVADVLFPEMQ